MKVVLKGVRLSFPALFEKKSFGDQEPKFGATLIFEEGSTAEKDINKAALSAVAEKVGEGKAAEVLAKIKKANCYVIRDGDEKSKWAGYEGCFFIIASSKVRPLLVNRRKEVLHEDDGTLYAGCLVNASVDVWMLNSPKYQKRVCAKLLGIQFHEDADRFDGGATADLDDFEDSEE